MSSLDDNKLHNQEEMALQWMSFLRRRSKLLGFLWPVFLLFAVVAGVYIFHLQQDSITTELKISLLEKEKEELVNVSSAYKVEISELEQQINTLKRSIDEGVSVEADEADKEKLAQEIAKDKEKLESLEEQLALLKFENTKLNEAFQSGQEMMEVQSAQVGLATEENKKLEAENIELKKKLESRKVAYSALTKRLKEMQQDLNRLDAIYLKQENDFKSQQKLSSQLTRDINDRIKKEAELNQSIEQLKDENSSLQRKLSSMLAPVGAQSSYATSSSSQPKSSVQKVGDSQTSEPKSVSQKQFNSLVFEEIKFNKNQMEKGEPEAKSPSQSGSFDYDQVVVP